MLMKLNKGEKEEEALILSLVADFALKACDFEACLTICDILMSSHASSPAAVKVCSELVRNESYENIEAKARLSSFCVTYCSNETLGKIITFIPMLKLTEWNHCNPLYYISKVDS